MSRSAVSDNQNAARAGWAAFFASILRESRVRITNDQISDALNEELGGGERKVSASLVTKWRSPGGKRKLVPKDDRTANALARALVRLGAFDGLDRDHATEKQRRLVTMLNRQWDEDRGQEIRDRLKAASLRELARAVIEKTDGGTAAENFASPQLSDEQFFLIAACQLTQLTVESDTKQIIQQGGSVVFSPLWDATYTGLAGAERVSFEEELINKTTIDHFRRVVDESGGRVTAHILFRLMNDGIEALPNSTRDRFGEYAKKLTFGSGRKASIWWRFEASMPPRFSYHFWLHLHKDRTRNHYWRLLLHSDLYKQLGSNRATSIAALVDTQFQQEILGKLEVELTGGIWQPVADRWTQWTQSNVKTSKQV